MTDAQTIAERYLATWNETDPTRRGQLLSSHWTADATYVDPMAKAAGTGEIDGLIDGVQARFPGFRFALKSAPDGHGDHVRFAWMLGPEGEPPPIEGSDVVMTFHDRIACVIGFLDKVPAAAA
jgi:hypothetical protein